MDSAGLGALHPNGSSSEQIAAGTLLELPFWLGKALHAKGVAAVETPKVFSQAARAHLKADPSVLSLRITGDFYQIGLKYAELSRDPELLPSADSLLLRVFANRHPEILNKSQSWVNEDNSKFLGKLTPVEHGLFAISREASVDFASWKRAQGSFSQPSSSSSHLVAAKRPRLQ